MFWVQSTVVNHCHPTNNKLQFLRSFSSIQFACLPTAAYPLQDTRAIVKAVVKCDH